jgi:hypothetical protein
MAMRINDARLASRNFTKVVGDKPFGVGASMTSNDPEILYIDLTGQVLDEVDEDDDWDDYFGEEEVTRRPLDLN